jgi:hypothetical protein
MAGDVCVSVDVDDADECNVATRDAAWSDLEVAPSVEHGGAALNPSIRLYDIGPPPDGLMALKRQRHDRDRRLVVPGGLDHYLLRLLTPDSQQSDFSDNHLYADVGDIPVNSFFIIRSSKS